jgi:hypothetical protein
MRRLTSVVASTLLGLGFVWQVAKIILDYAGRGFAMRDLGELLEKLGHWFSTQPFVGSDLAPWVLMGMGALSLVILHAIPGIRQRYKKVAIELHFPLEANHDSKDSLFRRSTGFLPDGQPLASGDVCLHEYYIGVHNPSDRKTLKNVRVVVESAGLRSMQWPLSQSLTAERTRSDAVDIPPKRTEYFAVGDYIDHSSVGMFHPAVVSPEQYREWAKVRDARKDLGFRLILFGGHIRPLLKNDGNEIHLAAYADDTSPTEKVLLVNCKTKMEMHLC